MVTKVCKVCGKYFKAQRNNACYCSGICRIANRHGGNMEKHNCNDQISIYDISEDAMEMHRDVYVWIDDSDDLELPIAVCDSAKELSELTNFSVSYINDLIAKAEARGGKSKFMKVRI